MKPNLCCIPAWGLLLVTMALNAQCPNSFAAEKLKEEAATPMGAARTFFAAMQAGDTNLFTQITIGTDYQKDWMLAYIRSSLAIRELDKASTAKFGKEQTEKAFGEMVASSMMGTVGLTALTNSELKAEGTNATITFKLEGADPLKLQQVTGKWRVLLGEEINKADFDKNAMVALAECEEQCIKDVQAGKYKTAEEASQAVMSSLMAKVQSQKHPADK